MLELAPLLGILAGMVGVADTIPYVRDIVRGTTRPHRGTWLIWGTLAVVVLLSQRADGASWSLVLVAVQAVLTSAIFALAIRRGVGGVSPTDIALIALAGAGGELDASLLLYPVYYCLGNAAVALLIVSRAGSARPYSP
jgi:hypothetical protein